MLKRRLFGKEGDFLRKKVEIYSHIVDNELHPVTIPLLLHPMDKTPIQNTHQSEHKVVQIKGEAPVAPKAERVEKHLVFTIPSFLTMLIIVGSAIGGAFYFGDRMGSNKFDIEKNNMHDSIFVLNQKLNKADKRYDDYKDSCENEEIIKQIDNAVTHDLHSIPAWEVLKSKIHKRNVFKT